MKPGKIVIGIDQKVYFEYYELEKPEKPFSLYNENAFEWRKYEASKRLIEISNDYVVSKEFPNLAYIKIGDASIDSNQVNETSCKAEVTGDKATIVELN